MFNKIVLAFSLSMILVGAAIVAMPIPVLWGTACLTFIALFMVQRRLPQA